MQLPDQDEPSSPASPFLKVRYVSDFPMGKRPEAPYHFDDENDKEFHDICQAHHELKKNDKINFRSYRVPHKTSVKL